MENFCKNCKFVRFIHGFPEESECLHPTVRQEPTYVDPVTGDRFAQGSRDHYCVAVRSEKGLCKPEGELYVARIKNISPLKVEDEIEEIVEKEIQKPTNHFTNLKNSVMITLSKISTFIGSLTPSI